MGTENFVQNKELDAENNPTQTEEPKKKKKKYLCYLMILLLIILLLLLLKGCGMGEGNLGDVHNPTPTPDVQRPLPGTGELDDIEEYDPDKIRELLNQNQNTCEISASNYLRLKDKDSSGVIKLHNKNDYWVQVSILPYDDGVIRMEAAYFTSILIGPNEQMNTVKLDKNLDSLRKGKQPCLLLYDCYKKDENGEFYKIGSAGLKITVDMETL